MEYPKVPIVIDFLPPNAGTATGVKKRADIAIDANSALKDNVPIGLLRLLCSPVKYN